MEGTIKDQEEIPNISLTYGNNNNLKYYALSYGRHVTMQSVC